MSDENPACPSNPDHGSMADYDDKRGVTPMYRTRFRCSTCYWTGSDSDLAVIAARRRTTATVSTTCARCSATVDPDAVEQHHAVCFRIGDYVRWEWPAKNRWAEGTLRADREVQWCNVPPRSERRVILDVSTSCSNFHDRKGEREFGLNDGMSIRHIQRPGQAIVSGCAFVHGESDRIAAGTVGTYRTPHVLSVKVKTPEPNCTINGVPAHCPPPMKHHRFVRGLIGPGRLGPPRETCATCQRDPRNTVHHSAECRSPHRGAKCGCAMNALPEMAVVLGWKELDPLEVEAAERENERHRRIAVVAERLYDGKITGEQARELLASPDLEQPAPTLYDGLTGKECLERYEASQREQPIRAKPGERIFLPLTPIQLAAARELWSLYLKQRISAAKERDRLTVRVDLQDEE